VKTKGAAKETCLVMTVDKWLESEEFAGGLAMTPQLPCPCCIRMNDMAEGVIRKPRSRKPKARLKDAMKSPMPEMKEWCEYVKYMRNCIAIGRSATAYALGSVTTVSRRNAEFKKRSRLLKRLSSLEARMSKKASSGFISEAADIHNAIEKLREELKQ
jgi:hypothetical protein